MVSISAPSYLQNRMLGAVHHNSKLLYELFRDGLCIPLFLNQRTVCLPVWLVVFRKTIGLKNGKLKKSLYLLLREFWDDRVLFANHYVVYWDNDCTQIECVLQCVWSAAWIENWNGPASQPGQSPLVDCWKSARQISSTTEPCPHSIFISIMSPPAWLSHPLFNVASFLILGQVAKRMNLDDPTNLMYARAVYVMVQAIIMGLCYWLMSEVQKKNGKWTKE